MRAVHGGLCGTSHPRLRYANSVLAEGDITSLCVVGERHSGTNFLATLLRENFAFPTVSSPAYRQTPETQTLVH